MLAASSRSLVNNRQENNLNFHLPTDCELLISHHMSKRDKRKGGRTGGKEGVGKERKWQERFRKR